ncbi:MAG TPA: DUF2911 domain-containing protein [Candidatus Acidoferrum sp.]|jgi:hypothetical protein|nr:DUF2911 domain-containing protein [Candidatus Acidoferrum sp.]
MRKAIAFVSVFCLGLALFVFGTNAQQDKSKRPSPPATASLDLGGGKSITIDYSSPRLKGRHVGQEIAPYGQVWRVGANEATTFVTTADITVGGTPVPAGNYTLFAIPNKDKWTLIISKKTGEWGTNYAGPSEDLARVDMKVSTLPSPVENFTISFDKSSNGGTLNMDWETTRASAAIVKK